MSEPEKTTRRQFLKGHPITEGLAQAEEDPADQDTAASGRAAASASYLMQVQRRAMACDFAVFFNARQHTQAAQRSLEALELVEQLEDQMTVYRDHSEICEINRRAASKAVVVEPRLFQLLQLAVRLSEESEGAFDVTSGPLSRTWGFYRRAGSVPTNRALAESLDYVGSNRLTLNENENTIQFQKQGLELNLGGIGKGYALDRCVEYLLAHEIDDFLLHGGQSSVVARGSRVPEEGWSVGIRHPLRAEGRLAEIYLHDRAIGTSGTARQSFHHKGRRYGHVLDPRTGWPADGVLSCSVLAPSAAVADALSTAFYVLGVEKSVAYCQSHTEVAFVMVTPGDRHGKIEVHSHGLADEDWQLFDEI